MTFMIVHKKKLPFRLRSCIIVIIYTNNYEIIQFLPALVCLIKCFMNSIPISLLVKPFFEVTTVVSRSIFRENQSDIKYFPCIIISGGDGFLPAASIASIIVRDHQSSGLTK